MAVIALYVSFGDFAKVLEDTASEAASNLKIDFMKCMVVKALGLL